MGKNTLINRKKTILVVDDDPTILEGIKVALEEEGYIIETADDGEMIKQKIKRTDPDLILLDYLLPGTDGIKITQHLKKMNETKHIPIIMISASYNSKKIMKEAGADDFLAKPFNIDDLLAAIDKHI